MKKVGIIAAMQEEMNEIKNIMTELTENNIYELQFFEGKIGNVECVLVQAGVGKVNASRCTQILIDNYDIEYVVNVGSAGSANNSLNIGDIVIGKILVQHDFDITAFGHKKGYISNVGENINSDDKLIKKFEKIINNNDKKEYNIKVGTIASGDIFCTDIKMKEKIKYKFNADAIEMEGAAIAHAATLNNIPFLIVRAISDKADNSATMDYGEFEKKAIIHSVNLIMEFVKNM